jgi:CHAD domain-containing protein
MRDFAEAQTLELLRNVVAHIYTTADDAHPEAVHKLRVSIRRLQQSLRLFRPYFPKQGAKRVRKQMRSIMKAAGELRNRDIALDLLRNGHPSMTQELEEQRLYARRELVHVLTGLAKPGLRAGWLSALALGEDP